LTTQVELIVTSSKDDQMGNDSLDQSFLDKIMSITHWRSATCKRNYKDAEYFGQMVLDSKPQTETILRGMARQYTALGAPEKAIELWQALLKLSPHDFEAACMLVRFKTRQGHLIEETVAQTCTDSNDVFKRNVAEVLKKNELPVADKDSFQHIAICGVSYCGSTLMDRLLGSLPQASSIGESHCLTQVFLKSGREEMRFDSSQEEALAVCQTCGETCEVLDFDFRRSLQSDRSHWYRKIAHKLETTTLISSDKNLHKYALQDPRMEFDAIVLFKGPHQAWQSNLKYFPKGESNTYYEEACREYLARWVRAYEGFVHDLNPLGRKLYINFELFAKDYAHYYPKLLERLGLNVPNWRDVPHKAGHALAGNLSVRNVFSAGNNEIDVKPLSRLTIPETHRAIVDADESVKQLHNLLKRLHVQTFHDTHWS
jgi:tetratricopeptide (TPR) repeat protein